ncbi:SOK1 [Arthroderma uncinatum]|uniref:SOK1 n=1 Tax=Arthroderma uncinatum TaxID=74035 RepID=UPI00144A50D7|nr:SOK1 [Arthroderma uncinatum]KAF3491877.1 SOK1 [Arthroderma uncinatum]
MYNGLRSSLPPSPTPPPIPFPHHRPELQYPAFEETSTQEASTTEEADEIELERYDDGTVPAMVIQIPAGMQLDARQIKILQNAERLPPIRTSTLSELDLNHIMRNINLRVDVNFDRELHFQPIAGEKGHEKRKMAEAYWEAIALEISVHGYYSTTKKQQTFSQASHQTAGGHKRMPSDSVGVFEPRLPVMLETLKDVVSSLVPERDQQSVMQNLDVPFLLQQVHKGVLDMVNLTKWLAALLKTHCAPMRDPWADKMVAEISEGCATGDTYKMVDGLRTMFGTLESMKLDVANHQIRAFRVILIDDTVRFLQSDFRKRMAANAIDISRARRWYLEICHQPLYKSPYLQHELRGSYAPIALLFMGLFSLLVPFEHPKQFPDVFEFDAERLWFLRADIQDLMGLEICSRVFELIAIEQGRHSPFYQQAKAALPSRICCILDNCPDSITADFDARKYDPSTPNANDKWRSNIGQIALEIAQSLCSLDGSNKNNTFPDGKTLHSVEKYLEFFFTSPTGQSREFSLSIQADLEEATFAYVKKYLQMTPLEMAEDQRPRQYPDVRKIPCSQQLLVSVDGIAKRLAHIGVLHWRVWAPVLYLHEAPGISFAPGSHMSTMYATE